MKATLVCYDIVPMPIRSVTDTTAFASSKYGDDVRHFARELRGLYGTNPLNIPDQYAQVVFYRDATPDDHTDEAVVDIQRRILTESAMVSSFDIVKELDDIPDNAQWVSIYDWHNATLTMLHFRIEK